MEKLPFCGNDTWFGKSPGSKGARGSDVRKL